MVGDIELDLTPCLSSQGVELRWRTPGVEGTLDNRVLPYLLPSVEECCFPIVIGSENVAPLLVFVEYTPIGIILIS